MKNAPSLSIPVNRDDPNLSEILKSFREHIPYVLGYNAQAEIEDNVIRIDTPGAGGPETENAQAALASLYERVSSNFRFVMEEVEFEQDAALTVAEDPYAELEKSGQIVQTARGVYVFKDRFARVMLALDDYFRAYALSLGAEEHIYPPLLGADELIESGYVGNFPQNSFFISHFDFDLGVLDDVSEHADKLLTDKENLKQKLAPPSHALSPTVCYHCFQSLKGAETGAAHHVYTALGKCGRHEAQPMKRLARLQLFTMREIIFMGDETYVTERLGVVKDHARQMLTRWGLKSKIVSATDPFFAANTPGRQSYQSIQKLKFEMQLYLPVENAWVSCASFNNHQQSLTDKFAITCREEKHFHSCCIGYGYERFAYALFCQFGTDIARWPDALKTDLKL